MSILWSFLRLTEGTREVLRVPNTDVVLLRGVSFVRELFLYNLLARRLLELLDLFCGK